MPDTSGQSSVPSHGDSEEPDRDRLARVEDQVSRLADAVYEHIAQCSAGRAAEEQAEAIIRRAAAPDRPRRPVPPRRGRRSGDTFLHVVKVGAALAVCLTLALAALHTRHLQQLRYTPGSAVQVAHVHNDHDADDR